MKLDWNQNVLFFSQSLCLLFHIKSLLLRRRVCTLQTRKDDSDWSFVLQRLLPSLCVCMCVCVWLYTEMKWEIERMEAMPNKKLVHAFPLKEILLTTFSRKLKRRKKKTWHRRVCRSSHRRWFKIACTRRWRIRGSSTQLYRSKDRTYTLMTWKETKDKSGKYKTDDDEIQEEKKKRLRLNYYAPSNGINSFVLGLFVIEFFSIPSKMGALQVSLSTQSSFLSNIVVCQNLPARKVVHKNDTIKGKNSLTNKCTKKNGDGL